MAGNVFDQFDNEGQQAPQQQQQGQNPLGGGMPEQQGQQPKNPFDQFDQQAPTPQQAQQQQAMEKKAAAQSTFMDAVDGLNRQFGRLAEGGLQLGAQALSAVGIDTSNFQQRLAAVNRAQEAEYAAAQARSPIATGVGSALGAVGAGVQTAAMTGGGLLTPAGGIVANMGKTGVLAGLQAGAEYAGEGESRFDKAMTAGALGAGAAGVLGAAGAGVGKLFQRPVQEAADEISAGLRPTLGQATGNETVQSLEQKMLNIPLAGTGGGIKRAAGSLEAQVDNTLTKIDVDRNIPTSDIAGRLKQGFQDVYTDATQKTNAAYTKAMNIAKAENIDIPLGNTNTVAKTALDEMNALAKEGISSGDLANSTAGKLITDLSQANSISASNFENLRKLVSGKVGDLAKSSEGSALLPIMRQLRSGLDMDLDTTAKQVGGKFSEAIQGARNMYAELKAPYKNDPFLKKVVQEGMDTDMILNQAVKNERPEFTKKLFNKLTPDGQAALSEGIIDKALKIGIDPKSEAFDVRRFSGALGKMGETLKAMPDKYAKPIIGLKKLLTRGDYLLASNARGGSTSIGALMGTMGTAGYLLGGAAPVAVAGLGLKAISTMLTNPNISRALVKLAGGKISEKAQASTIRSILNNVTSTLGAATPAAVGSAGG